MILRSSSLWRVFRFSLRPAAVAALLLLGTQCAPMYYGNLRPYQPGQTQYLGDAGQNSPRPQARYASSDADNVSWWRGDGVPGKPAIVISLKEQRAYFYKSRQLVGVSILSTGDPRHPTPVGHFEVMQKDQHHRSSQYGDYYGPDGQVVKPDVDRTVDPMPRGAHYVGCEMENFMRFSGGKGMHAGYLPGYPASHGCVRMPEGMSAAFFRNVEVGTPVEIRY